MAKIIKPINSLRGEITLPGDKSVSHRAIMLGAIAAGVTRAKHVLDCDDCNYTIDAFRTMGINIKKEKDTIVVDGKGLRGLSRSKVPLYVGESGTTMRLLAGILAGQDFETTLKGAGSLSKRPMKRIVEPLSAMGAVIKARDGGHPPLIIKGGGLNAIDHKMTVPSAQVKSAILLAGLYADGVTTIEEKFKSRDHTEKMFQLFGADIKVDGFKVSVKGGRELEGRDLEIPGDISSASFFIAGATMLKGSRVKIRAVGINPTRSGILNVLERMGARIKLSNKTDMFEPVADIEVESSYTRGTVIKESEIPSLIDELPVIFALAAASSGKTVIEGAEELRVKETDRIASMEKNLKSMGARIMVEGGNIIIDGAGGLKGADLKSFGDHRTCMASVIAALSAQGESSMDDTECVNKSFPGFFKTLEALYVK